MNNFECIIKISACLSPTHISSNYNHIGSRT